MIRRKKESEGSSHFQVVVRVRPPLPRELQGSSSFQNIAQVQEGSRLLISEHFHTEAHGMYPSNTHHFTFDQVYGPDGTQREVYEGTAQHVVASALLGYNATLFAYGQTGTGTFFIT